MSHTVSTPTFPFGAPTFVQIAIQNYAQGGEQITATELGGVGLKGVNFFPTIVSSLGVLLIAFYSPQTIGAGLVRIFQISAGAFAEIPTTNALNCTLQGYAQVT